MEQPPTLVRRYCSVCTYAVTGKKRKDGRLYAHGPSTLPPCNSTEFTETVYSIKVNTRTK